MHQIMRLWSEYGYFCSFGPENVDFRSLMAPIQIKKHIVSLNLAQFKKLSGIFKDLG